MPEFIERNLKFTFDEMVWRKLIKGDKNIDYKKMEILNNSKAVDFLGFCNDNLYFIEVTDYRGSQVAEDIMIETGIKVKDTIAGIVGAARNSTNAKQDWLEYGRHLLNGQTISVVLWLEENNPSDKREKAGSGSYSNRLKNKLKWLIGNGSRAFVTDSSIYDITGLTVTQIP